MVSQNLIGNVKVYTMLFVRFRLQFFSKWILLSILSLVLPNSEVMAQDSYINEIEESSFTFDGVPVLVIVQGAESFYVDAVYASNDLLYVSIDNLFKTLSIPCIPSQNGTILSGFIENESQKYVVDYNTREIKVGAKVVNTKYRLIKENGMLYLDAQLFAEAFGLTLTFNFRSLTIILKSNFELPIIKQQKIDKLRSNVLKLKGEEFFDTTVERNYHLFKFGTIDWSVASYQTWKGTNSNRFGLGVGAELLYGEANVSVNYYDQYKFDNRQLHYIWRWVDNEKKLIKQAQVGKISTQTVAFINAPIIGATIRNTPTTVRKAKGYYTLNEYTEPNWDVELYINNVMVDYTKADASGLYVFKVPIVYGYTTLLMKFYGPLGEERTEERTINMPYSIMPTNEFEYGASVGVLQDSAVSRFGRGDVNYGVNRYLTVGGGLEYLSSIPNGAFIPFARATIQPYSKLTLNVEYAYGVKTRGVLNLYFLKNALIEIDYSKYVEGQLATRFNALEERKVKLSIPFRINRVVGFSRADFAQFVYKSFLYNQASVMFSAYYSQFSANSATQLNWIDSRQAYVTSTLSMSYRANGYVIRPSAQYNVTNSKLMLWKIALEKSIPRGFISASYERNVMYNDNFITVGLRYDLSFARTSVSASHSRGNIYTSESAQGSLAFGSGNKYVHTSNNTSVGRGGISLYPFLDINRNGIFDKDEPMVKLTAVRVMGSKAIYNESDSIVRIAGLNPFIKYIITFSDNDLGSVSWRFKHKTYEVLVDPNQFKRVDIPIVIVGEFSGTVYLNRDSNLKGIGRILVKFYKENSQELVAETQSEYDGYVYYLGFEPGNYVARFDSTQLRNLGFSYDLEQIPFTIKQSEEGDFVSNVDFVLNSKETSSTGIASLPTKRNIATTASLGEVRTEEEPIVKEILAGNSNYTNISQAEPKQLVLEPTNSESLGVKEPNALSITEPPTKSNVNEIVKDNSDNSSISVAETKQIILENTNSESPVVKDQNIASIKESSVQSNAEHVLVWGDICDKPGNYYVQCGAFKVKANAISLAKSIKQTTGMAVGVVLTDNFYKVQVECLSTKAEANDFKVQLMKKLAINEIFITARQYDNETINSASKSQTVSDSLKAIAVDSLNAQTNNNILIWGEICDKPGFYYVQCGAFKVKNNAMRLALSIKQTTGLAVGVILTNGFYKVQVECMPSKVEVEKILDLLKIQRVSNDMFLKVRE